MNISVYLNCVESQISKIPYIENKLGICYVYFSMFFLQYILDQSNSDNILNQEKVQNMINKLQDMIDNYNEEQISSVIQGFNSNNFLYKQTNSDVFNNCIKRLKNMKDAEISKYFVMINKRIFMKSNQQTKYVKENLKTIVEFILSYLCLGKFDKKDLSDKVNNMFAFGGHSDDLFYLTSAVLQILPYMIEKAPEDQKITSSDKEIFIKFLNNINQYNSVEFYDQTNIEINKKKEYSLFCDIPSIHLNNPNQMLFVYNLGNIIYKDIICHYQFFLINLNMKNHTCFVKKI